MTSKDLDKSLIDYLKEIPDQRNPHGRRHPLWLILLIIIMAIISGYWQGKRKKNEAVILRSCTKKI